MPLISFDVDVDGHFQEDAHISTWEEFDGKFEEPFELLGLDDPECPKKEIRAAFRQVARPALCGFGFSSNGSAWIQTCLPGLSILMFLSGT